MRALSVLDKADRVALVVTPDIPSLRLIQAALLVPADSGSAADRATYVVNDIYPRPMIGREQIEEHLGLKVGHQVPYDGETFVKAVNEGQPYIVQSRRTPPAAANRWLAEALPDGTAEEERARVNQRGILAGFLNRTP